MAERISTTARGAFAVLVAAGLTFGSSAALASPTTSASCPYNPNACTTHQECGVQCRQIYGQWSDGICDLDGCCVCAY